MNRKLFVMTVLGLYVNAQGDTFTEDPGVQDIDDLGDEDFVPEDEDDEPALVVDSEDVDGEDVFATAEEEVNKEAESLAKEEENTPALSINVPFFIGESGGPTWIGLTSVVGIIWWFVWGWFVYLP